MKRKNIILIIVAIILLVAAVFIIKNATSTNNSHEDIDVDELINKLTKSEGYSKMSYDEKKESCRKLLEELKEKGAIKYYSYSDTSMLYSFEYKDGSLGGIMLKEWDPKFN